MTFGLYLSSTLAILILFGVWVRGLIIRRLKPERILSELSQEVQAVILDLNAAGDQNISLLEDRIEVLKSLLQRADIQIDEMERRLRELERRQTEKNEEPVAAAPAPEPALEPPVTLAFHRESPPETVHDPRQQVLNFSRQGLSSELIASRTGIAIGEVELIISLGAGRTRS